MNTIDLTQIPGLKRGENKMRKSLLITSCLLTIVALTLAACCKPKGPDCASADVFCAGEVTDVGGIDDKSFNATAWQGMENAKEQLGITVAYLESQQQTDYAVNLQQFVDQDYDMIVTVGYLLADDTLAFAQQNPEIYFAGVDQSWESPPVNLVGLTFSTDQAAFLAGYLAAGMTKSGKVGTFGGIEIPPVTIFMVGYQSGVEYYNQQHGTSVEVLGATTFVGNFESTDDGRRVGEDLIAEGADIILPVAGPVGLGTAAAVQAHPGTMLIGVDTDWCVSASEYCPVVLTSIMKRMDMTVPIAIQAAKEGTFQSGTLVGTLENGGVGLAPFHDFDSAVSSALKAELETVRQGVIDGSIDTGW
jgi:basic membrane protein A